MSPVLNASVAPASLPVEIRASLSREEFEDRMHPVGAPVIVAGAMRDWPAMQRWTFEFFRTRYGRDTTLVEDSLYDPTNAVRVRLAEYLAYLESPQGTRLKRLEDELRLPNPFYAYGYKPFQRHPELLKDFTVPDVLDDWSAHFSWSYKYLHFPNWQGWVFLSPLGAKAALHTDLAATILWHAQVRGRKRCVLFSPRDTAYLYDGDVDPLQPDLERFPLYQHAQPFECVLEPGMMLFLPPNWFHYVLTLEPSITISYNVVNRINFGYYVESRQPMRFAQWLRRLPVEPRDRVLRRALGSIPALRRLRRALRELRYRK